MEELVILLKQTRQEKNISLEEISAQTRIQLRYLEAVENNDFSPFTGEVYVKGALCNYAEIVGLDPKEIMALYHRLKDDIGAAQGEDQLEEERQIDPPRVVQPVKKKKMGKREGNGPTLTAGVVVVVLALIGLGIWFSQNYNWPVPNSEQPENNIPDGSNAANDEDPAPEDPQPVQQVTVVTELSGETAYTVTGFSEMEIIIAFQGPCWVQLTVNGTEPFYPRTFLVGEDYTVTAAEAVRLRLGNPKAVRITVNGVEIIENRELLSPHNFVFNVE